jgi:hypothetical protein
MRIEAYMEDVKVYTDSCAYQYVGKVYSFFSRVFGTSPRELPQLVSRGDPLMNREFFARWRIASSDVPAVMERIEKELGKEWRDAFQRAGFASSPQTTP